VAVALTALTVVAPGAAPSAAVRAASAAQTDLLVGDSVMAGLGPSARALLPNHVFDAKVCRRLIAPSCSYRGVRPATALAVVGAYAGVTNRAVVVAAGYNDDAIGGAVDAIVAEARRQGVPHVVWLTYRVAGRNAAIYRSHNAVLMAKAQQHPELTLADWAGHSAGRSDWVADDGLHLEGAGATAMANLVAAVLAGLRPPVARGATVCFPVAGDPGDAALVNLTPVRARGSGHGALTSSDLDPAGPAPATSNVNFALGTTDPNAAIAPVGADGEVCYRNGPTAAVHLVADHLATIRATRFAPATPDGAARRLLDTRAGRPLGQGERRCVAVAGRPGDVAVVNLTPVRADGAGHGLLVSSDVVAPPDASNVNYAPGTVDPNVALAPIGADGRVCYQNAGRAGTHLVADHLGSIDAAAVTLATAAGTPARVIDTRPGAPIGPGGEVCVDVAGEPGDVAVVNLTPVRATGPGHGLLIGGDATVAPEASNVNYAPGTVDPNLGVAAIGAGGDVCFANADRASVHLVADHLVTLAADAVLLGGPTRVVDTRR
jgi:hypothetical protein